MSLQRKLISFIGLGAGNTASFLYSYISFHPEVCVIKQQTNFFNDINVYKRGIAWYESNFSDCAENKKYGELASTYLESAQAPALIARAYSTAKLLAVIDNPIVKVKVAYVEAIQAKKLSLDIPLSMFVKQNPEVLTRYRFGRQLTQYFTYYSHNDLLVIIGSEVDEDPLKVISVVYEHLEIDKTYVPLLLRHLVPIEEEDPKHRSGIIKKTYRFIRSSPKKVYNFILKKLKPIKILPDTSLMIANKIQLSPELEAYLKDYYQSDVKVLSSLLHRDLNEEWGI